MCKGLCEYPVPDRAGGDSPPLMSIVCCLPFHPVDDPVPIGGGGSDEEIIIQESNDTNFSLSVPLHLSCSDLTPVGFCSKNKPFYCDYDRILKIDAWQCGCFPGYAISKKSRYICEALPQDELKEMFLSELQLTKIERGIIESPEFVEEALIVEDLSKFLSPLYAPKIKEIIVTAPERPLYSPIPSGFAIKIPKEEKFIEISAIVIDGIPKINFRI